MWTRTISAMCIGGFGRFPSTKVLQTPITLGGPGSVVQVGNFIFFHSPKYILYDFALQDVVLSQ